MGELSPEAKELLGAFTSQVLLANAETERRLAEHINHTRVELSGQIAEVRQKLDEHGKALGEHGKEIAVVKTRLEEGEKRFEKQDQRIDALETRDRETAVGVAKLAGAAVGGGAIGAALSKFLAG